MHDSLITLFADIFNKRIEERKDPFLIIKFSVPLSILSGLYDSLIKVDVPAIETLPLEQKNKYWNIAKQFHESEVQAIKGSKAAYILELITNTN